MMRTEKTGLLEVVVENVTPKQVAKRIAEFMAYEWLE